MSEVIRDRVVLVQQPGPAVIHWVQPAPQVVFGFGGGPASPGGGGSITGYALEDTLTQVLQRLESTLGVQILNLPNSYPLPLDQLQALEPQTDGLTRAELDAAAVAVFDDYDSDILTSDQVGAGDVLVFTLGQAAPFVTVDVDVVEPSDVGTYICRVTLDGVSVPTASLGHRARSGQTTYLPFPTAGTVRVFAPAGVFVSVQAGTR